jgi:antitoxin (DNA-binding transcriptional repressor) of toxin-antitoxin stability system
VRSGDEVIVTDRGRPVARLIGSQLPGCLEQLLADATIAEPIRPRPRATGRSRVPSDGPVSDLLIAGREQRRA